MKTTYGRGNARLAFIVSQDEAKLIRRLARQQRLSVSKTLRRIVLLTVQAHLV